MAASGVDARAAAVRLVDGVMEGRLLSALTGGLDSLAPEDRARAQRLAVATLRNLGRADAVLKPYLKRNPPDAVRNVLRVAATEICTEAGAAHGVVNAAVDIVGRNRRMASMKGLVNAVLRKVAADGAASWAKAATPMLPRWLREPLIAAWGKKEMRAIEAAHATGAPLDVTARGDAAEVAATLGGEVLPTGSVRLGDAGQVSALPGFAQGAWWVQDAAAAIPARVLAARAGERVLDLCAAPGGKTMQMAAAGAEVTALDESAGRMARLEENLARTGLVARSVVADARMFAQTGFDAILLDAPCSATGTIRRHPDLPYAKDGSEFGALIALQAELLDHALTLLRPGGRLVFCTCSLLPDEGEVQIDEALARHAGLTTDRDALALPGVDPAWITEEGGLRLRPDFWPDLGGMDGFYIACLRRS